jgi:hypothetical protein
MNTILNHPETFKKIRCRARFCENRSNEEFHHLEYNAMWSAKVNQCFGEASPPSLGSKNKQSTKPAWKLVAQLSCWFLAACSSEPSVGFQRTILCYIPADRTLHNHRCENLKYYIRQTVQKLKWERIYRRHGDFISLFFRWNAGE